MNINNINKTIDLMRTTRDYGFYMGLYHEEKFDDDDNVCGTNFCLAGFACVAKHGTTLPPVSSDAFFMMDMKGEAASYFGIDEVTAEQLFIPGNDGIEQRDMNVGIRALEHLRDTGEVLWDNGEFEG